jgi:hypothetical protein
MNPAKVVLGLALGVGFLLALARVARLTDVDDPVDVTTSAVAALVVSGVYGGLFVALAYA